MKNRYALGIAALLSFSILVSCSNTQNKPAKNNSNTSQVKEASPNLSAYLMQSVLWVQNSGEYKALCYQAFNAARLHLDIALKNYTGTKKRAIITDIDETVLNNSPYEAKSIQMKEGYNPKEWDKWVKMQSAKAVPGAADFLNYAKSKGVEVFYVSNRLKSQGEATLANLQKENFPFADTAHLLLKDSTNAKKWRFEEIEKTHQVLLFMGDNLADFKSKFNVPSTKIRNEMTDSAKTLFGSKFIVLPNPMYGGWQNYGIYRGRHWSAREKDSILKAALKAY